MKKHVISREGRQLANTCIEKCNEAIFMCQKLRDFGEAKDQQGFTAETPLCVKKCHECIAACTAWSVYCREHREECADEDCTILYSDALLKSDECIKACGDVINEISAGTTESSLQKKIDACVECVEACDECIERCANILNKHL